MLLRKWTLASVSLLVALTMLVTACTPGTTTPKTETPPAQQGGAKAPATGGEFVYHVPADPDTFASFWAQSAYSSAVTSRVFGDGLLRINAQTLRPEPALAEAMPTVGADNMTYTFKLRKGVKYHDGVEVKAQDIAYTYEILMHDDYKGRSKSVVANLASVKALDDWTIEMKTKTIFAPFMFTVPYLYPLPKAKLGNTAVKDLPQHEFWKKPIGAGPWKFVEWKAGQHTLLERYDGYYRAGVANYALAADKAKTGIEGPFFDRIRIRVIPETNTAIAALEAGELTYYGSMEPSMVDRLKSEKKDQLSGYDWDRLGYGYQTFNTERFPTNIREVRQAMSHALNRDAIIKGVMENKATLPAGFVPPIHWVFNKDLKPYNYNLKSAQDLLEGAGFKKNAKGIYEKDGKPLKILYVGTKGSPIVEGVALQSQKDWQTMGAEVEVQLVDFNTLLAGFRTGDFNVSFSGLGFSVDPHTSFNNFHTKNIGKDAQGLVQGSNTARYSNTSVDALIDRGAVTIDLEERKRIYQQAEALIMNDAPVNPIYVNLWTDFIKKNVKGVSVANGYGLVGETQYHVNEK